MTLAQVDLEVFNLMGERLQLARSTLKLVQSYVTLLGTNTTEDEEGRQQMLNTCWMEVLRALDVWAALDGDQS